MKQNRLSLQFNEKNNDAMIVVRYLKGLNRKKSKLITEAVNFYLSMRGVVSKFPELFENPMDLERAILSGYTVKIENQPKKKEKKVDGKKQIINKNFDKKEKIDKILEEPLKEIVPEKKPDSVESLSVDPDFFSGLKNFSGQGSESEKSDDEY